MTHSYTPEQKICPQLIEIDYEDNKLQEVTFFGGCEVLHQTISLLLTGKTIDEAIELLDKDLTCGRKSTSCTMELVKALKEIKQWQN